MNAMDSGFARLRCVTSRNDTCYGDYLSKQWIISSAITDYLVYCGRVVQLFFVF